MPKNQSKPKNPAPVYLSGTTFFLSMAMLKIFIETHQFSIGTFGGKSIMLNNEEKIVPTRIRDIYQSLGEGLPVNILFELLKSKLNGHRLNSSDDSKKVYSTLDTFMKNPTKLKLVVESEGSQTKLAVRDIESPHYQL